MKIQQYLSKINTLYTTGNAREHSYRGDLQNLIMAILPDILVTNEPARVECGAPDYVLTRKDIPVGYIEAKDIGVDLADKKLKEQFDRYKSGLSNLIFTDYMDFHFYKDGKFVTKIAIARLEKTTPSFGHPSIGGEFVPIDLLDYIYAVLHSPSYREKYKEFLKIDFPRVPYPTDLTTFGKLSNLGAELRQIHLLESPIVSNYITQYPEDGDNVVVKPRLDLTGFKNLSGLGRVYINETQYFDNVPEVAWNFYIGGYQPAQKWLKDRKERELSYEDILHYQKIIVALSETDRIMKEIDTIKII